MAVKRALIGLALLWSPLTHASLGGDIGSIAADQAVLGGSLLITTHQEYELREINNDAGMSIREFVSLSGIVFAVVWSGPAVPNLQSLLGSHYASAARAVTLQDKPGTHRSFHFETPDLVVQMSGHLRSYSGLALLKALEPAGLSATELR